MFTLPPASAAPPSFGGLPQYQQMTQPQLLQSTQAVQPMQQPVQQQPVQQPPLQGVPMNGGNNLQQAVRNYPNAGLSPAPGPTVQGMPSMVKPPPMMGPNPQFNRIAGNRMPTLNP